MKEKILAALNKYGSLRKRYIASAIGVWTASPDLSKTLHELEDGGIIKSELHRDIGNMESYYLYHL